MNKVYSKKELKAKAQEVFEQYPSEDKVFAREDGNIFFNENLAELGRGKLKVYPFDRSDIVKTDKAVEDIDVDAEIVVEAPVVETPKVETPVVDTPAVDTPKVETPVVDTPAVDAPKVETPVVDAPAVDTPKVETPVVDTPAVDTPKVETPVVDAPKVETPKVDKTLGKDGKNPETRNSNKKK
ncbi:hypothetical protein [Flavobacterium sasangense]|uniref:hypothetical protein n=1 Tax=Flavobacterium sasangense TaxID=503361 RepID=UPI0006919CC1|nr:hypothetical protein [Flavobacterium sasangense]